MATIKGGSKKAADAAPKKARVATSKRSVKKKDKIEAVPMTEPVMDFESEPLVLGDKAMIVMSGAMAMFAIFLMTYAFIGYLKVAQAPNIPMISSSNTAVQQPAQTQQEAVGFGCGYGYGGKGFGATTCLADECLMVPEVNYPAGSLPDNVKSALDKAIASEYDNYNYYTEAVKKFGPVKPFIMVLRSEEQHISALKSVYDKYGIKAPEAGISAKVQIADTIEDACADAADREDATSALYQDELLPVVSNKYPDIESAPENVKVC